MERTETHVAAPSIREPDILTQDFPALYDHLM